MVMKLNKSIPRIMKERPSVYAGMIMLTFLSVLMFVLLALVAQNLYVSKEEYVRNNVREDLEFTSTTEIENSEEIENKFALTMESVPMTEYTFGSKTLRLFSASQKVNIPAVLQGELPQAGEIALDPSFAKANDYYVGSTLEMNGKSYTISGIITLPNYAYILQKQGDFINDPTVFGLGLLSSEDMQESVKLYSVKYDETQDNIYEQAKPLKAYLNEQGVAIASWDYAKYNMKISLLDIEVTAIVICSALIPTIFMLITAFLIAIVQSRLIKSQSKIIGTLYAQGYRRKELITHYLCYPVIIAVFGSVLGGLAGMAALKPALAMMLGFFQMPVQNISYNPLYLLFGTILCCFIFSLGSFISLKKIFRRMPSELLRNDGKEKNINILERKINLSRLPFKTKFAVRERLRSIPNLIFTVIGVMIASMFILYGFAGDSSFASMLNPPESETFHHSIEYASTTPRTDPVPEGGETIAAWNMIPTKNFSDRFQLAGITDDAQLITLKDRSGSPLIVSGDMVVISAPMANRYGLAVGDTLSFIDVINDGEYELLITDIADVDKGDYVFMSLDGFDALMGWEQGSYNAIMATSPLELGEHAFKTKSAETMASDMKKYTALMRLFVYGICAVAFALGIIILYIIASISIDESKEQISLMKVFGYKSKEVSSMMLNSSRIFVVLGYLIGAPMGFATAKLLFIVLEYFDISLTATMKPLYYLVGFTIIMSTFEVAKTISTTKIDKLTLSEALKTQEE